MCPFFPFWLAGAAGAERMGWVVAVWGMVKLGLLCKSAVVQLRSLSLPCGSVGVLSTLSAVVFQLEISGSCGWKGMSRGLGYRRWWRLLLDL